MTKEELTEKEKNLMKMNGMDRILLQTIRKVNLKNNDLDLTLIGDLHTLINESSISLLEIEIRYKYLEILLNRAPK
ncbi:hypothetical protein [Arcobacter arenosus]|uniref:hypothetical protein n=1 Tax=Arcobacter arenosus TaxID=2576037 RepID=UPI003BAC0F7B